jgi:hypothetical protein
MGQKLRNLVVLFVDLAALEGSMEYELLTSSKPAWLDPFERLAILNPRGAPATLNKPA